MVIHGWSMDDTVTLATTDTQTEGETRWPSMDGPTMDGPWILRQKGVVGCSSMDGPWMDTVTLASMDTQTEEGSKVFIHGRDGPWMDTITVTSTDTQSEGKQSVHPWTVHGWSIDGTVTLASMDTYTEGSREGVNPWTVHRWHSNSGIHGYLDRRGQAALFHEWSIDGQIKGVVKVAIYGWSMDMPSNSIGCYIHNCGDTLTFMDDTGLSMAAPDIPGLLCAYIVRNTAKTDSY